LLFLLEPSTDLTVPTGSAGVAIKYTQSGGTLTLTMPESKVDEIINNASDGRAVIDASGVSGVTDVEIPKSALEKLANTGSIKEVSHSSLTEKQRAAISSNDLVFEIAIMSGTQEIHNFYGKITITVPYDGELPVAVWYLNDNGDLEEVPCVYDEVTKTVSFTVDHLSLYVIGLDKWHNPFVDVKPTDWFYRDVKYAYTNNLMVGISTEPMLFGPNMTLTRGMAITVLYRLAGSPDVSALPTPFDDVDEGKWYADAVKWATVNGIVSGYGNGKFGPGNNITREQLALMIINYQTFSGKVAPDLLTEHDFADDSDISNWAKTAVKKLTMQGIINGKPGNLFDPKGGATRAEFVAILHRYLEAVK